MDVPPDRQARYWTAAELRALTDDGHQRETVHGKLLVSPRPPRWHDLLRERLANQLREYQRRVGLGRVVSPGPELSWAENILVRPDLIVTPFGDPDPLGISSVSALLLVCEFCTPLSARADRFPKRHLYQTAGIADCWMVSPGYRVIECWTPGAAMPVLERERITWHPAGAAEPCVIGLTDLFREDLPRGPCSAPLRMRRAVPAGAKGCPARGHGRSTFPRCHPLAHPPPPSRVYGHARRRSPHLLDRRDGPRPARRRQAPRDGVRRTAGDAGTADVA